MNNVQLDSTHLSQLHPRFYNLESITALKNSRLASLNHILAKELGIDISVLDKEKFIAWHNGEINLQGSTPHAYAYSGHQFGYFVPNLGDGRTINLGKLESYHLQLKGAGVTKYSREGDGRAVLRSSIREYLASEAMHGLGIPTTRALSLIASDTPIYRKGGFERGAMVMRASSSWVRIGSFEFAYLGANKVEKITNLANFVITQNYPHLQNYPNKYTLLYQDIVQNSANLFALWQSVGFVHGVLNSDNMSILGQSIDYGPYGFMERFESTFVPNLSDFEGRYAYENQPMIAQWNLEKLAKVFAVIAQTNTIETYTQSFMQRFKKAYTLKMQQKLGILEPRKADRVLIKTLLQALQRDGIDYTLFFYYLAYNDQAKIKSMAKEALNSWLQSYEQRVIDTSLQKRMKLMQQHNPKYILREYMLEDAIVRANENDFTAIDTLLKIVQNPFDAHKEHEHFLVPSVRVMGCSCSS